MSKGRIREGVKQTVHDFMLNRDDDFHAKFVVWVMKQEKVDQGTAIKMCCSGHELAKPQYTLGYKLTPSVLTSCFMTFGKKHLRNLAEFEQTLDPEELKLFLNEKDNIGKSYIAGIKAEYKKEQKK